MLNKVTRLRCADCGSTDLVLEGQGVWDASLNIWIIPEPPTEEINGVRYPLDDTAQFFCRQCGEGVGVNA
jgi:hypothetical protein